MIECLTCFFFFSSLFFLSFLYSSFHTTHDDDDDDDNKTSGEGEYGVFFLTCHRGKRGKGRLEELFLKFFFFLNPRRHD